MALVPEEEASRRLGVAVCRLEDKRYRTRIGLPAVHIGRRIGFDECDIDRLVASGCETLPVRDGQAASAAKGSKHEAVEV